MNDPEMTFRVDQEKRTMEALTFGVPIYQQVYPEPGKWIPKLRNDLNNFAAKWMKNITAQKFIRERAVAVKDGEDVEVFFSPEGTPIAAYDILMREADAITAQLLNDERYANARMNSDEQNSRDECYIAINRIAVSMLKTNPQFYQAYFDTLVAVHQFREYLFETTYQQNLAAEQPLVSAVTLYREALAVLVGAVKGSSFYDYLRDRETDYDSARNELDAEITAMMEEIKEQNPALHEACHTLPKFREWLIEDILEQTYQDVITDPRDAVQRYAGTPDAPAWIQEAPAQPERNARETAPQEEMSEARDPLAPAYREGDTVYIENKPFIISKIDSFEIQLQYPNTVPPLLTSEEITHFEYLLRQDPRNLAISDFLSADTSRITREILTAHLLTPNELEMVSHWFRSGEGNIQIAGRIKEMLSGRSGSVSAPWNSVANYSTDDKGFRVTHQQNVGFRTWEEVAAIYRSLWQLEFDGFSHEPPTVDTLETEQAEANTEIPPAPEPTGTGTPENVEMVWHTPGGKEYRVGDTVEYFVDGVSCQIIIDSIGEDYVYYTFPDLPQAPAEMLRGQFETFLDDGGHSIVHEVSEHPQQAHDEPSLAPNVDEYINLKAQYPNKLVGVQVGDYLLFYGKDAEEAASALNRDVLTREIPGLGETSVTGCNDAWQAVLKKLLEHGKSVVLARPDPQRGPDAPYEIIKERDISEYIPLGKELAIDGRRMKVDSIDYDNGKVSLLDMEMAEKYRYPVFREEPVAYVREYVEEAEWREFEQTARIENVMEGQSADEPESQDHAETDALEEAKRLIEDFCDAEYGCGGADFSDLEHIGIAYTTTEDERHEIQVEVNLLDFSVTQMLDDQLIEQRRYKSLREMIDNELSDLDFEDLIHMSGEPEQLLATVLKAAHKRRAARTQNAHDLSGGGTGKRRSL